MRDSVRLWKGRLYDARRGWVDGTTQFALLIQKRLRPDMRILDLGAGPGKPGPVNFKGNAAVVVGVDPDGAIQQNGRLDCRVVGVAEHLPFSDASFDLVYADWVIEHLANPAAASAEVCRVLRTGGLFLFRTGNLAHYSYAIGACTPHWFHRLIANRVRGLPHDARDPYPTCYGMNTRRAVRRILGRAGFVEEDLVTVEAEPSYLMFSMPTFLLGAAYERLVNRVPFLAGFRACLFGCFRKAHVGGAVRAPGTRVGAFS